MRIYLFALVLSAVCFGAIDAGDLATKEAEVKAAIELLPVKRIELEQTVYTGTIKDIISQRIADVNEVFMLAKETKEKGVQLVIDAGYDPEKVSAADVIFKRATKADELEMQKVSNEIIDAVIKITDPNQHDPADPNYSQLIEQDAYFLACVTEMLQPL